MSSPLKQQLIAIERHAARLDEQRDAQLANARSAAAYKRELHALAAEIVAAKSAHPEEFTAEVLAQYRGFDQFVKHVFDSKVYVAGDDAVTLVVAVERGMSVEEFLLDGPRLYLSRLRRARRPVEDHQPREAARTDPHTLGRDQLLDLVERLEDQIERLQVTNRQQARMHRQMERELALLNDRLAEQARLLDQITSGSGLPPTA